MKTRISTFSLIIGLATLLASCAKEPANWVGSETTSSVEEELALGNCECVYNYFASVGINVNRLLSHYEDFAKVRSGTPRAEVEDQFPALKLELSKIPGAKAEIRQAPCYRALVAKAEATQPNGEKVLQVQRSNCRLQLFLELY